MTNAYLLIKNDQMEADIKAETKNELLQRF